VHSGEEEWKVVSLREKYHLWRKKALPASKADVTRLHESIKKEISILDQTLRSEADAVTAVLHEIGRSGDSLTTPERAAKHTGKHIEEAALAFSYSNLGHMVAEPEFVSHSKWLSYLSSNFNKPGVRILEVGSRNVTGGVSRKPFSQADYVGFDFYHGESVDIVGDAHKLSSYFDDLRTY
jgi:hypothetical protein